MSYIIPGKTVPLGGPVNIGSPVPNIDAKYGPYNSVEEAFAELGDDGEGVAAVGLTVGIRTADGIKEYWFKKACAKASDLVPKGDINTSGADIEGVIAEKVDAATAGIKETAEEASTKSQLAYNLLAQVSSTASENSADISSLGLRVGHLEENQHTYGENLINGTYEPATSRVKQNSDGTTGATFPYSVARVVDCLDGAAQMTLVINVSDEMRGSSYWLGFEMKNAESDYGPIEFDTMVEIPDDAPNVYTLHLKDIPARIHDYEKEIIDGAQLVMTSITFPAGKGVTIRDFKVEPYEKSSPWTPSPHDMMIDSDYVGDNLIYNTERSRNLTIAGVVDGMFTAKTTFGYGKMTDDVTTGSLVSATISFAKPSAIIDSAKPVTVELYMRDYNVNVLKLFHAEISADDWLGNTKAVSVKDFVAYTVADLQFDESKLDPFALVVTNVSTGSVLVKELKVENGSRSTKYSPNPYNQLLGEDDYEFGFVDYHTYKSKIEELEARLAALEA